MLRTNDPQTHQPSSRTEWTPERIELLKRMRTDGVAYAVIAAHLGVTRSAVSGKVDRLGLGERERTPRGPRLPRARLKVRRAKPVALVFDPVILRSPPQAGVSKDARPGRCNTSAVDPSRLASVAPQDDGFGEVGLRRASHGDGNNEAVDPSARSAHACSLLELTEDTCRWPVGDIGEPDFFFCGQVPIEGAPYCGPHCRMAFRPLDARPVSEFVHDRNDSRVLQPDTRFGQFANWDVT